MYSLCAHVQCVHVGTRVRFSASRALFSLRDGPALFSLFAPPFHPRALRCRRGHRTGGSPPSSVDPESGQCSVLQVPRGQPERRPGACGRGAPLVGQGVLLVHAGETSPLLPTLR